MNYHVFIIYYLFHVGCFGAPNLSLLTHFFFKLNDVIKIVKNTILSYFSY